MLNFLLCKIVYVNDFHFFFGVITPRYHSISTKCECLFRTTISPWELFQQIPQTLNSIRKHTHEKKLHVFLLVLICQVVLLEKNPQF